MGNLSLFPETDSLDLSIEPEERLREEGFKLIAGVDEAGRGPLAGPVTAAAVILSPGTELPGVGDSKKMTPAAREKAFWLIMKRAEAVSLGLVYPSEIDRINILQATLKAMAKSVAGLKPVPDFILVDGISAIPFAAHSNQALADIPQSTLKRGDSLSLSVGAASVLAKVFRDRMMKVYDRQYPQYGFAAHKGYGTSVHLKALRDFGPSKIHRFSFKPIRSGSQK
jgi:ribonuclease HII